MQRHHTLIKSLIAIMLLGGLSAVLIICATFLYLSPKLPSVDVLREAKLQVPLRIYSQNGDLIGEFGEKLRTPIKMADVPEPFINAILSAEDDRFLQHQGIDIAGLLRAAGQLFTSGEIRSGGSTITMQVARNFFLSSEKTFVRKFNEIFLALQIERTLSKNEILELYVNKIYLGKRAYGIQAAAGVYYGKNIQELSLPQLAMIAGLPKAPSAYNPINNPQRAKSRRDWILGRMFKLGYISQEDLDNAQAAEVSAFYHGPKLALNASYAAEMARAIAIEKFGRAAYTDGYKVITTIDSAKQLSAQKAVSKGLIDYDTRHGYRGPESRFSLNNQENWPTLIATFKTVNNLVPAVITGIGSSSASDATGKTKVSDNMPNNKLDLLLANGRVIKAIWDPETNQLRKYINENRRASAIKDIAELLNIGDVIRIRLDLAAEQANKDKNPSKDILSVDEANNDIAIAESADPIKVFITQLPEASASLVSLEPDNGAIVALVGGFDFQTSKFNRATQANRQTGSNFKPFIYSAAMENGFTVASVINDAPIVFSDNQLESDWRPENSGGKFYGPTTLRRALYLSRNLVSVRLLRELGIGNAIEYLDRFEFGDNPLPRNLSLALGSYAMTPVQVASAYATLANGGYKVNPYLVSTILDRNNKTVHAVTRDCASCAKALALNADDDEFDQQQPDNNAAQNPARLPVSLDEDFEEAESLEELLIEPQITDLPARQLIDPRVAYIIDSILQDVIRRGTGIKAKVLGRSDLAGKTGTTNGPTDAWFSGYHPELVTTTWLGFDNNKLLGTREFGGSAALPIWIDYMRESLAGVPTANRSRPKGVVSVKVNRLTGAPAAAGDIENIFESFLEEFAPEQNKATTNTAVNNQLSFDEELF